MTKDSSMCAKQINKNHIGQERDRIHQCASEDVDDDRQIDHNTMEPTVNGVIERNPIERAENQN